MNDIEITPVVVMMADLRMMVHKMEKAGIQLDEIYSTFQVCKSLLSGELRREKVRRKKGYTPHRFIREA